MADMRSRGWQSLPGVAISRSCRRLVAALLVAGPSSILATGPAAAWDRSATLLVKPVVSADRIEDVAPVKIDVSPFHEKDDPALIANARDPSPNFENFAWRAFIALNWPSLTDPAHRGAPDRAKTLDAPGPRVWETLKARYELFQVGTDGKPVAPQPWATYDAATPWRAPLATVMQRRWQASIPSWISTKPASARAWP